MLTINTIEDSPLTTIPYLNAAPGGRGIRHEALPIGLGEIGGLPDGIDAIVFASDLQGRERAPRGGPGRLLGELTAEWLADLADAGQIPALARSVALLCGDLYTVPHLDRRGGLGAVDSVWSAFATRFGHTVGVSGNHDEVAGIDAVGGPRVRELLGGVWLDGGQVACGGLRIGGVSGVIGNPRKPNRHRPEHYEERLLDVLYGEPDIVLLHQDPSGGGDLVASALAEALRPTVVAFGHRHKRWWHQATPSDGGTLDLLAVDARVLVLKRAVS